MKRFLLDEKIVYVYSQANGNILYAENKHAGNTSLKQMTADKFFAKAKSILKKTLPRKITVDGSLPKKINLQTKPELPVEPIPEFIQIPEHILIPDPQPIPVIQQPILSLDDPYEGYL